MHDAEADMRGAPLTAAEQHGLQDAARAAPAVATRTFARRVDEVPVARRFIRDTLADHPASLDAELLACELVTNAVRHATDAARVTVAVTHRGPVVHVDVIDDGRTGLPHWREADGHDEDGRGFQLVNEIAQRWGSCASRPAPASGSSSRRKKKGSAQSVARGSRHGVSAAGVLPGPGR